MLPEQSGYVTREEELSDRVRGLERLLEAERERHSREYGELLTEYLAMQGRHSHNMGMLAIVAGVAVGEAKEK